MTLNNLFNMTSEEFNEWFRKEIIDYEPDPEFKRRLDEYNCKIENDFQTEWAKKKFKWFFKKRRQKKLKAKIFLRYEAPIFWIISDAIDEILGDRLSTSEYFNEFVDVKNIAEGERK